MKLFPFTLARITGLPFQILDALKMNEDTQSFLNRLDVVAKEKDSLHQLLLKTTSQVQSYQLKKYLSNLRRDLHNDRRLKTKNLVAINWESADQDLVQKIRNRIVKYEDDLKQRSNLLEEWELIYTKHTQTCSAYLQQMSYTDILQKGMILSSRSLMERISSYQKKDPIHFGKKERQTEQALLKYLTRIASKVSPFSTFTNVGIVDHDDSLSQVSSEKIQSFIRLNNYLFAYLQELLLSFPSFYQYLKLEINPSLQQQADQYLFILNTRNVESVQQLDREETVDFVLKTIASFKEGIVFTDLLDQIKDTIDADKTDLANYILQLIQFGALEWRWDIAGTDPNWPNKLLNKIRSFRQFDYQQNLIELLEYLLQQQLTYIDSDVPKRKAIQDETHLQLKSFSQALIQSADISVESEQLINVESFERFKLQGFSFLKEQIFLEDTTRYIPSTIIDKLNIQSMLEELNQLNECLIPLSFDEMSAELLHVFKTKFANRQQVNLIEFYDAFFRTEIKEDFPALSQWQALNEEWLEELSEKIASDLSFEINIDLKDLKQIKNKLQPRSMMQVPKSFGALVQQADDKFMINACFMGYGKMMGRFLHLFPQTVTTAIKRWNDEIKGNQLWVENRDASYFNANLHPSLFDWEIRSPASQNDLAQTQQISIADLDIKYDKQADRLYLFDREQQKELQIFNYGIEGLGSRSPMYRMLSCFGVEQANIQPLIAIVNAITSSKNEDGIIRLARLGVGERLILQRKTWLFPSKVLPLIQSNETTAKYFLRIQKWRQSYELPNSIFITVQPDHNFKKALGEKKITTDDYKPQYIDFDNPLLVQLFSKLIKRVTNQLKIEEMLPSTDQLINMSDHDHAAEFIVHYYQ